ncbi:MAG: ergothioneine biosynthesis protein EgtB [Gammaproteobacteria bacterium]|nr:ergothioneine biosynthesis protein EgtB [Gammaproteobacteria bacterium]
MIAIPPVKEVSRDSLKASLLDARARTHELLQGLDDEQLMGPRLAIVNPLRWEIGHVAWFHEYFILQQGFGRPPLTHDGHLLYDSIAIAHHERWDLPLPPLQQTLDYLQRVEDALIGRLGAGTASALESYLYQFTVFHEDMHDEAFTWARQTLAYPRPDFALEAQLGPPADAAGGALDGDVHITGGEFLVGAMGDAPFVFDNEKWAHAVTVRPFAMARAPVTNEAFRAFVDEGGYGRREFWTDEGWAWRQSVDATHPVYWQRDGAGGWLQRQFDALAPLAPYHPVVHVNWYEASAWCRWAGRRLPREHEWEVAALGQPCADGSQLAAVKRRYPWSNESGNNESGSDGSHGGETAAAGCNLDGRCVGCVDVGALADGDSAFGCRQMLGNVWEWCHDPFTPYPGFVADAYKEYSQTLFGHTRVLRGGSWATRSRYITGLYRNFFGPSRNDIFAGFRTCALE